MHKVTPTRSRLAGHDQQVELAGFGLQGDLFHHLAAGNLFAHAETQLDHFLPLRSVGQNPPTDQALAHPREVGESDRRFPGAMKEF